jgi:hypothetical protein
LINAFGFSPRDLEGQQWQLFASHGSQYAAYSTPLEQQPLHQSAAHYSVSLTSIMLASLRPLSAADCFHTANINQDAVKRSELRAHNKPTHYKSNYKPLQIFKRSNHKRSNLGSVVLLRT